MDTLEYQRIIAELEGQLEVAKRESEKKRQKEEIGQRIKLREHWISKFEEKKAEFVKYGLRPPIDIDRKISEVKAEKAEYERELVAVDAPPQGPPPAPALSDADRNEAVVLIEEVTNTAVAGMVHEERWTLFEIWSLRWRIIAERAGDEVAETDTFLRTCFARIRERMKDPSYQQGWFIDALNKASLGDWTLQLKGVQERLAALIGERKRAEVSEEAIRTVTEQAALAVQGGGDDRTLRHAARHAAKFEHLREEVAEILLPLKAGLADEFGFLWDDPKEKEEPEEKREKLTNRDIAERILRRMRSKALIGECHGPYERICKGFPEHDKGRAKEAVELMCKAGLLRKKSSIIGSRLSLESKLMLNIDSVIQKRRSGIAALDEWLDRTNGEK